jgi:predicted GNAT superfamily acetyltransferase
MYGSNTGSTLHGSLPTDRFIIAWDLELAPTLGSGNDAPAPGDDALPLVDPLDADCVPRSVAAGDAETVRVQVPIDSHGLTSSSSDLAGCWRYAVRESVMPLMADGYRVTRFVRASDGALPYYVFSRNPSSLPSPVT